MHLSHLVMIPLVKVMDLLRHHKIAQNEHRLKLANKYENNNLVFCNKYDKYLTGITTNVKFREILKDLNIQNRCFHDLRHTYATRLFELDENPKTVGEIIRSCQHIYYIRYLYSCIG